ncbi:hypothetical protein IU474_00610 [Nocardia otitidiscaviarum]|uniref:hypothetical protein n=1 Tax=Nocardia otitidiscaviarum TaxID=1823 RepID=UPI001893F7CA|nr:hypothetical protein [Nocardia otitidiscaviarum]MBF6235584.1 hypothetical protein [Nocardia otitidiscaviarum]
MFNGSSDQVPTAAAADLIEERLRTLVAAPPAERTVPPAAARQWLDNLLSKNDTYRDATLAIIAISLASDGGVDVQVAIPGRRAVTQRLTKVCKALGIPCKQDAFQTLGKGQKRLDGLDRPEWRALVKWLSTDASPVDIAAAFEYVAEDMSATARVIPPMPELNTGALTFPRMWALFESMLDIPSRGVHEQMIFAALLHALILELGDGRQVKTKNINASDASAGTAADVQVLLGGQPMEAYEVTANSWKTKLSQAEAARVKAGLMRLHIVASGGELSADELASELKENGLGLGADLSVLDIRHEIRSMTARLTRSNRPEALQHLYELLVHKQPDHSLVDDFVARLVNQGLVIT